MPERSGEVALSFSAKIKEEIFQSRPARKPHYRAFCYGLLLFGRRFGPQGIEAATEHPAVSKLCGWAIRDAVGARPSLSAQKTLRGQPLYTVELSDPQLCERLLASFGHRGGVFPGFSCRCVSRLRDGQRARQELSYGASAARRRTCRPAL